MEIQIDRHEIYDKQKVHEILVFPKLGHMWDNTIIHVRVPLI